MSKSIIRAILVSCAVLLLLNVGYYLIFPDIKKLNKQNPKKSSFMEYREREWAAHGIKKKIRHQWAPLSSISPYVSKAVIIAEDDKFWSHEGFDFNAMKKALKKDIKKKKFSAGGSTISQQLAKNLYLSPSKNPLRKIKEAILTWRIERHLSKRRILELYLNYAEWGSGIFGIQAAAKHYYRKNAAELSAMEAAKLVSVLPNPRRLKPTDNGRYVAGRSERIYEIMVRRGIVIEEYDEIMNEPIEKFAEQPMTATDQDRKPDFELQISTKTDQNIHQPLIDDQNSSEPSLPQNDTGL